MKIKFHKGVFYDIRRSPKVVSALEGCSERIAAAANSSSPGYATGSQQGVRRPQGRWRTSVVTGTAEAMVDNARNNTLVKSMDAGKF